MEWCPMSSIRKLIRYWWKNWHKQMERYTMFLDRNNHYYQNDHTTQSTLQIQCNLYQIGNGIFTHLEQKSLKVYMEKLKTPKPKQSWEKNTKQAGEIRLSDFRLSYTAAVIKQYVDVCILIIELLYCPSETSKTL